MGASYVTGPVRLTKRARIGLGARGGAAAFNPGNLSTLIQRFADAPIAPYFANLVGGFPVLTPEEPGTVAVPQPGACALFAGDNDYLSLGARLTTGSPAALTVAAWIKTTTAGIAVVFGEWSTVTLAQCNFILSLESGNALLTVSDGFNGYAVRSSALVNTGEWVHVTGTASGGVLKIYINGVLDNTASYTTINNNNTAFLVGQVGSSYLYPGSMREILVEQATAYSPSEVATLFTTHLPPTGKTPLGFWPLQERGVLNGGLHYNVISNSNHLTANNITASTYNATDSGVTFSYPNAKGYTDSSGVIIPASLSDPTKDAAGNALGVVGPVAYPATVEVPCVTGDGSYVDSGSALIPPSANWSASLWYYHVSNDTTGRTVLSQNENVSPDGRVIILANYGGGFIGGRLTFFIGKASGSLDNYVTNLQANTWHFIEFSRTGDSYTIACTPLGSGRQSATATLAGVTIYTGRNSWLMGNESVNPYYNNGRFSDLRITTAGVTKYFWLAEGDSRHVYWIGSDGTGGKITNAIVSGTVATIRGQRCPFTRDPGMLYGGGVGADGEFVVGRIGSNLDANGNVKTIQPGEPSPYSSIYPNRWNAPALVNVGITSSTAWGKTTAVQATSPADTKFRNTTKGTKNIVLSAPATGSDKTNLENYVST